MPQAHESLRSIIRLGVRVALVIGGWMASSGIALAHPIHRSIAEVDYHRTTGKLEIALRVFADDFEAALSARAKKKISLERTPADELDHLARSYLTEHFAIKTRDGTAVAFRWIGRELKDAENELWFFFEASLEGRLDGARLHHTVLSDQFSDQLNSVLVRDGDRKVTLFFLPNSGEKRIYFRPE